jgi:peroxiredoxin
MIPFLILFSFFQSAGPAANGGVPLRDGCSADDLQLAVLTAADRIEVREAIGGGGGACYHVDAIRDGKRFSGYVLGEALPAVASFVAERDRIAGQSLEAMAREAARPKPQPKPAVKGVAPARQEVPVFESFSGRDVQGKYVSLAGLPGRVIVVQFWTPRGSSRQELMSLMPLYKEYRGRGLSVVGLSVGIDSKHLPEALDDVTLPFPAIPDPGLARHYSVDMRVGKTYVLDTSHHVLASGSAADAIKAVKGILSPSL